MAVRRPAALLMALLVVLSAVALPSSEAAPASPTLSAERDGARIFLSWDPPPGNVTVLHYNVYRGTDPGNLTFYGSVDGNYTAGYDLEVVRGWTYYYAISANTTEGEGELSPIVAVPPPGDAYPVMVMGTILVLAVGTLIFAYRKGRGEG